MALRLSAKQYRELMGPNGHEHELLGGSGIQSGVTSKRKLFPNRSGRYNSSNQPSIVSSFYGRHTSDDEIDDSWQPGEYLLPPTTEPPQKNIEALLSQMQGAITARLDTVQSSVDNLSCRVDRLEENHKDAVEQLQLSRSSSSSTDSEDSCSKLRMRHVALDTSNTIRTIHNNLSEEKQLKTTEPIDGPHNRRVIAAVLSEMCVKDEHCTVKTIKGVLGTYRKTLCRKRRESDTTTRKRLFRSRQQRKYDRRSNHVRVLEVQKWQDVVPTMMSDEEDIGENTFRVHRQEWRSQEMTDFLVELDKRADVATKKVHPRKNRVIGTPLKLDAPENAKEWMLQEE